MITRARPKYYSDTSDLYIVQKIRNTSDKLYFSSGRAALKFYLLELSRNRKITIAMQSFNCRVVADAALEAGCDIILTDIDISTASISLASLKALPGNIDVLLLTHYQGISNIEYQEIAEYCNVKNIILIEDLAHIYLEKINEPSIGSLSDANIYSYAFDKPLSCQEGGMLELRKRNEDITVSYNILPRQSDEKAKNDLLIFKFLYDYSSESKYHKGINNLLFLKNMFMKGYSHQRVYSLSKLFKNKFIGFGINMLLSNTDSKSIEVQKLHPSKQAIVEAQAKDYEYKDSKKVQHLISICNELGLSIFSGSEKVEWNRFSILDPDSKLKTILLKNGIEASNYNWPVPLHIIFKDNENVQISGNFLNTEHASNNVLNIPLWSNEIFKIKVTN